MKSLRFAVMVVVAGVLAASVALPNAVAEDGALMRRLAELTIRKGYKDSNFFKICEALSMPSQNGNCFVHEAPYSDESGNHHSVIVLMGSDRATRYIALVVHDEQISHAYLTSEEGVLQRAASCKKTDTWLCSKTPINQTLRDGFAKEGSYWRAKEDELAHEPDRKD